MEIDMRWTLWIAGPSLRWNCASTWLIRGQVEPQLVKTKFKTTVRPSFISSGSETALPSSRTSVTAGTAYWAVAAVTCRACGAFGGSSWRLMPEAPSASVPSAAANRRSALKPEVTDRPTRIPAAPLHRVPPVPTLSHHQPIDAELTHHDADMVTGFHQTSLVGEHHPIGLAALQLRRLAQCPHLVHDRHLQGDTCPGRDHEGCRHLVDQDAGLVGVHHAVTEPNQVPGVGLMDLHRIDAPLQHVVHVGTAQMLGCHIG